VWFKSWLLSLSTIFARFIHVAVCAAYFTPSCDYGDATPCFTIHQLMDRHLSCSHLLANVNNTAMSICVPVFAWTNVFCCLGFIPRSRIAELYTNCVCDFLGSHPVIFHNCATYIPVSDVGCFQSLHALVILADLVGMSSISLSF
jgi:hypothetical protein